MAVDSIEWAAENFQQAASRKFRALNYEIAGKSSATVPSFTVSVTNERRIRVTFSQPVLNNPALVASGNYQFTPSLTVSAITPEAVSSPNYVDIDFSTEMINGQSYTLKIEGIEPS